MKPRDLGNISLLLAWASLKVVKGRKVLEGECEAGSGGCVSETLAYMYLCQYMCLHMKSCSSIHP
jgi:hypothetical protein